MSHESAEEKKGKKAPLEWESLLCFYKEKGETSHTKGRRNTQKKGDDTHRRETTHTQKGRRHTQKGDDAHTKKRGITDVSVVECVY